jgi:hypothetical protein
MLCPKLNHAGRLCVGGKKQRPKVQVVCKYDMLMRARPCHDFCITGVDVSNTAPMGCVVACFV